MKYKKEGDWHKCVYISWTADYLKSILKWRIIWVTKGEEMCYVIQQWKELICEI